MKTTTDLRAGSIILRAPIPGRVRLCAPRWLCGELEVFEEHETIAVIENDGRTERMEAPTRGFLLRTRVIDGAIVPAGAPLLDFRPVR
jgi:hypothetical protein